MSDVDFDPENGSRTVQLARGVIFAQIRALVQPLRDLIGVMISPFVIMMRVNRITAELRAYANAG